LRHRLTLFGTSACHLCEQAEAIVLASLPVATYELYRVDIAADPGLFNKYGLLIPVLEREGAPGPLCWPFDKKALLNFLATE
jgi:hypothetical protein